MKAIRMTAIVLAAALAGCVNVDVPKQINVNINEDKGTSAEAGQQRPSQLPAAGGGSWRDVATDTAGRVFLGAEKGMLFYAYDTLAYPNEPVDLAARLQSTRDMKGVAGVTIGFQEAEDIIGTAVTDDDGRATLQWTPPSVGNYRFTAKPVEVPKEISQELLELTPAPLLVAAREKDAKFVVIDLDHTVVDSSFFRVLTWGAKPMADSVEVTKRIAEVYSIIYLTHRPDLLARKSKAWLTDNGYPDGPLLVSELKEAFGDSGKFKTARLKDVQKAFANVKIGIGDKLSDAEAYVDNGLTAYLIPHYKDKPKDMRKMASQISGLRGRDRLNVVSGWREIEEGIFKDRTFAAKTFANQLKSRADQIEREEKERKRREEKDDDEDDDEDDDDDDEDDDEDDDDDDDD